MKKYFTHKTMGRTAVVTGASSGIGESFARHLAREGYNCLLIARRKDNLVSLAREIEAAHGVKATALSADLSTDSGVRLAEKLLAGDDSIEVLVNAAGFGTRGFFAEVDTDKIQRMVFLHTLAPTRLMRSVIPRMVSNRRGYIINVSSVGAFLTTSHYVTYSATKAFINMMTRGLRDELAGSGVRIQALCPGLTRTGFMYTEEFKDFSYSDIPGFAWMNADDVVKESLAALKKDKTIFIPGAGNRFFVRTLTAPLIGSIIGGILAVIGRGKNSY
ncbi:MAG: SDR family oxidoreductase [Spirochaetes bacterium]|nr:SDR family oxidoreductase [Spirochaetota bacterium]